MSLSNTKLWTALVTPLTAEQNVDVISLEKIVKEQEDAGNGLLYCGSTGEALNLTLEERKQIVEFGDEREKKSPMMVGVGGANLKATLEWIEYLNSKKNIDAYLLVVPLYAKPDEEGQYLWFKTLMDASEKPVMLYNVPGRTGKKLPFRVVERLKDHPKLWALKEASGSAQEFAGYRQAMGDKALYCGDDGLLPQFAPIGCQGLVSVAGNAWPKATARYVEQCLEGNLTIRDAYLWQKAADTLFITSNPTPVKRLLSELGRISSPTMRLPLSQHDLRETTVLMDANKTINQWMEA
jgi:4-hydroxy-tetrahydrodipicolinate synthase